MKNSKLWRLAALLMASTLFLAACGGGDDDTDTADDTAAEGAADEAGDDEATADDAGGDDEAADTGDDATGTIDLWHIQTDNQDLIDNAVARYMEDHPGITVEVNAIENDSYKTQIRVAIGAGEAPCIFPSWGGGTLVEYVNADQVLDLTDWITADGYADRFIDASFDVVTVDDRIYGVPVENTAAALVWYNRALFDRLGLDVPTTWDELLEVIDALNAEGIAPFALANSAAWTGSMYYMYIADRLGGPETFSAAATRSGGSFEDPVFIQAGEMLQDLVERDAFVDGFNGLDWDSGTTRALLYSEEAAMEIMGNWTINIMTGENPEFLENNLGFFPFPEIEGGLGDLSGVVGTIGDNYYHVNSDCELPEQAFEVIQYLIDDTSIPERIDAGKIPPIEGFETEDQLLSEVFDLINNASSVQLWYDQFLPPELAEVHLETTQALFALEMTPEEAAAQMEQAAVAYFGE